MYISNLGDGGIETSAFLIRIQNILPTRLYLSREKNVPLTFLHRLPI